VAHDGTGPLVAVIPAEHSSVLHPGAPELVGVSAVDQSYTFLDLPGWVGNADIGTSWSLSPNGRWVAYWYADRGATHGVHPADGVAVLDTTTGKSRRYGLDSKLGVSAQPLAWSGDTLWFTQWDFTEINDGGSSAHRRAAYAWPLESDDDPLSVVAGARPPH